MFEVFEHTADLGLRIRGASREELFIESARALTAVLISNLESIRRVEARSIRVAGDEDDFLLFDWLNEILYLYETERLLLVEYKLTFTSDGLTAECEGEIADRSRHQLEHEVKAITYHGLRVTQSAEGWLAEVILDI